MFMTMKTIFESQAPCVSCLAVNNTAMVVDFSISCDRLLHEGRKTKANARCPSSRINGKDEELAWDANLLTKWSANCNRILGGCKFTGGEFGQERIAYDLQLLIKVIVLTMLVEHSSSQVICLLSLDCMTQFQTV